MPKMTATQLARRLGAALDRLEADREEVEITRRGRVVARLVAGPPRQNAVEALSDSYRTVPDWKTVSVGYMRANLESCLDRARQGKPIQVTYRGKPIAEIIPPEWADAQRWFNQSLGKG